MARRTAQTAQTENAADNTDKAAVKADNFRRLAGARLGKALDAIETLQGTCNTASYIWTKEQVAIIMEELQAGVEKLRAALGEGSESLKGTKSRNNRSVKL